MKSRRQDTLKLLMIVVWLVFTVVFAGWWIHFSQDHVDLLAKLQPDQIEHWESQKRMIFWEGTSWMVLLVLGGVALIALVQRERGRVQRIREFFASFSHEVKTSLASLRLQAEALKESTPTSNPILDRLIGDTVRLQLQLENSLFLSSQDSLRLYPQSLSLDKITERLREQWPTVKINLERDCHMQGDERALRTILSNLVQNSIVHGQATQIDLKVRESQVGQLEIDVRDNGSGFQGSTSALGNLFYRPKSTSGSGLGLYICRLLLKNMKGDLIIEPHDHGFHARLLLPGSIA